MSVSAAVRTDLGGVQGLAQWVVPLAAAMEPSQVGGKAHGLARMLALGAPVPDGFVLTREAFEAHLEQEGLKARIEGAVAQVRIEDLEALAALSQQVRDWIVSTPLPAAVREALHAAREGLPRTVPVAVRSSGVGEDSSAASFAGQLDTCLEISGADALEAAVRHCWASYWSTRAIAYQRRRGIALAGMGVVVQQQVDSAISGVLFTQAPDGRPGVLFAEYCEGLGEALVSGRVNPGTLVLGRDGVCLERFSPEPKAEDEDRLLSEATLKGLAVQAVRLEERLGAPQDIEWTIDRSGQLLLLQSRPITVAAPAAIAPGPVSARRIVWSNANINENFPEPVTPFLFSVVADGYANYFRNLAIALGVRPARVEAMEPHLRQLVGAHGARLYYNLSNVHAVLRLAPFGDSLAAYFDQFVGADHEGESASGRPTTVRAREAVELLRFAAVSSARFASLGMRVRRFEKRVDAFASAAHPSALKTATPTQLRDHLRAFLDIRLRRWADAGLADAAAMICYGVLKQLLRRAFPAPEQAALHNTLLKGLTDLASGAPVLALWELSRILRASPPLRRICETEGGEALLSALSSGDHPAEAVAFDAYLEEHGYRGSGELMLTVPSFQEDPRGLTEMLRGYVTLDGQSPRERLEQQAQDRERVTEEMIQRLRDAAVVPGLHLGVAVRRVLGWTQSAVAFRERARTKQALLYSRLRRIVLSIGTALHTRGVVADPSDVFFLTHSELDGLLSGGALLPNVAAMVGVRRKEHAALSRLSPPDRFELPEGESYRDQGPVAQTAEGELTGVGTCGGRVTARAAVLRDLSQASQLAPGDILVTRQTDPGWAPVFFLIKGLVMERGGMLSHGSILAREFGLPSVVGVRDATSRIEQGATVTVDGDLGHVRVSG